MPNYSERVLRARLAAHASWANTGDRPRRTAKARQAFRDRFEQQVDPDGVLSPAERAERAESARKAYYARLALKSAQARRRGRRSTKRSEVNSGPATPASTRGPEFDHPTDQQTGGSLS